MQLVFVRSSIGFGRGFLVGFYLQFTLYLHLYCMFICSRGLFCYTSAAYCLSLPYTDAECLHIPQPEGVASMLPVLGRSIFGFGPYSRSLRCIMLLSFTTMDLYFYICFRVLFCYTSAAYCQSLPYTDAECLHISQPEGVASMRSVLGRSFFWRWPLYSISSLYYAFYLHYCI